MRPLGSRLALQSLEAGERNQISVRVSVKRNTHIKTNRNWHSPLPFVPFLLNTLVLSKKHATTSLNFLFSDLSSTSGNFFDGGHEDFGNYGHARETIYHSKEVDKSPRLFAK